MGWRKKSACSSAFYLYKKPTSSRLRGVGFVRGRWTGPSCAPLEDGEVLQGRNIVRPGRGGHALTVISVRDLDVIASRMFEERERYAGKVLRVVCANAGDSRAFRRSHNRRSCR